MNELICILEKIGAYDYAIIVKKYGQELWRLFVALENDEIEEDEFYNIIEKANDEYNKLNGKLEELLSAYFVKIHRVCQLFCVNSLTRLLPEGRKII